MRHCSMIIPPPGFTMRVSSRHTIGALIVMMLLIGVVHASAQNPPTGRRHAGRHARGPASGDSASMHPSLAFISDSQEPMWVETLSLPTDRNEDATAALFQSIAAERRVSTVFHLGDMTGLGLPGSSWKRTDDDLALLRASGKAVHAIPGNHDYSPLPAIGMGMASFRRRFPECAGAWHVVRVGRLAVVLINSNISRLSIAERHEQLRWYTATLDSLDADSTIRAIIVGTHHSPHTNSTIVMPSTEIQTGFVPPFLRARKAILFASGHVHAFEHFVIGAKTFLVTGGGGGLLQPLLPVAEQRWPDLFVGNGNRRMFHYIVCDLRGNALHVRVRALAPDARTVATAYRITIPLP